METTIDILRNYPSDKYIPLIPVMTVSQVSPMHKMAINLVKISPDEAEKDVYKQSGGLALTKKGLSKLMAAANIQVVSIKKVPPSTCEKCLEMARSTGKPSNCATCPNKNDIAYEATLSVPDPAGGNRIVIATREFICEDEKAKMSEAQYKQGFSFRGAMTESKAINRAIRAALMIKSTYQPAELSNKIFAVPIVVPDATDPEMKAAMIERFKNGSDMLFGAQSHAALTTGEVITISSNDDEELDNEVAGIIEAETTIPLDDFTAFERDDRKVFCESCSIEITAFTSKNGKFWSVDDWLAWTGKKYGETICKNCAIQRGTQ